MSRIILFYGDSNTWGYRSGGERLPANRRYTTMATRQAPDVIPVVDGVNGRCTVYESACIPPDLLGGATFEQVLKNTPQPDGVVIMLGTNDVVPPLSLTAAQIAANLRRMVQTAKKTAPDMSAIVLVSPPPLGPHALAVMSEEEKARLDVLNEELPQALEKTAAEEHVEFLNGSSIVPCMDAPDGYHLAEIGHLRIGLAIGSLLRSIALPKSRRGNPVEAADLQG